MSPVHLFIVLKNQSTRNCRSKKKRIFFRDGMILMFTYCSKYILMVLHKLDRYKTTDSRVHGTVRVNSFAGEQTIYDYPLGNPCSFIQPETISFTFQGVIFEYQYVWLSRRRRKHKCFGTWNHHSCGCKTNFQHNPEMPRCLLLMSCGIWMPR